MTIEIVFLLLLNFGLAVLWITAIMLGLILIPIALGFYDILYGKISANASNRVSIFLKSLGPLPFYKLLTDISILSIFVLWVWNAPWQDREVYICPKKPEAYHYFGVCPVRRNCNPEEVKMYEWQASFFKKPFCDFCAKGFISPPYIIDQYH